MTDQLEEYRRRRDARRTPEPVPRARPRPSTGNRFVIQQHHARSLHWDVRLERDGVLVSFAVPRGLPRDRGRNNLAKHTEDHPSVTVLPTFLNCRRTTTTGSRRSRSRSVPARQLR